jgi:hypothetical protein
LVGSLNLGNPSKGPDPKVKSLFSSLLSSPLLWALAIGYGLWSGGIAYAIAWGLSSLGAPVLGGVIAQGITDAVYFVTNGVGSIFGAESAAVGSLFAEGSVVLSVCSVAVLALAAYVAIEYGGRIWHAITDAVTSIPIVGGVIQSVLDIGTSILQPIGQIFCCFDPEALVTMADGSYKKIKDIAVGDRVIGQHGQINTVLGIETPILAGRLMYKFNDRWAFVSGEHKLLTTDGWSVFDPNNYAVERASDEVIGKIDIGSEIITSSGTETVTSIGTETRPYGQVIYNLIVDGDHTFIVEGIVAGNRGCLITHTICEYHKGIPAGNIDILMIRHLRDSYVVPSRPDLIPLLDAYYYDSPEIVDRLARLDDRHEIYLEIKSLLDITVCHISRGQYQEGVDAFIDMMLYAEEATGITNPVYQEYYQLV